MNVIDLFELIAERSKLLEAFVENKITKEDFQKELDRLNDLICSYAS